MDVKAKELHRKYRPRTFAEVVGQHEVIAVLRSKLNDSEVPHALLFAGPSGCGKTTLARILAKELDCSAHDLQEINAADSRGIDTIREIQQRLGLSPLAGKCRVWLIDESHRLTSDAQAALLKMTEDTPSHAYFMFATTDPDKMLTTLRSRCTRIDVRPLNREELGKLVLSTAVAEGKEDLPEEVVEKIVEAANGSARMAQNLLNKVIGLENGEALNVIEREDTKKQAIELCRLLFKESVKWPEIAAMIKALMPELEKDPESFRRMVLGYANSVALGGGKSMRRAAAVINAFQTNWYDCGKVGLTAACLDFLRES